MSGIALSGLFSGMDTQTMITQLMNIEKVPYNKLQSRKNDFSNQQSQFRSLNTKLSALRDAAFDLTLRTNFMLTTGSSSDEKIAKISSSDGAVTGDYKLSVSKLAKAHSIRSDVLTADAASSLAGEKITVNLGSKSKEITLSGTTNKDVLNNLKNDINSANLGVKATVVQTDTNKITLVLTSTKTGDSTHIVQGTGTGNNIGFTSAGTALQDLNIFTAGGAVVNEVQATQNAEFTVNGLAIVSESNEVEDVVQNAKITLLDEGNATINVKTDADKIAGKVETFVKAYNDVIDAVNAAKKYKDSNGRTSLSSDSTIRSLETQISTWLSREVGGGSTFKHLFQIGLEVDKGVTKAEDMTGKIKFDKDVFKKQLAENPDAVFQVLAMNDTTAANKDGIAKLFSDNVKIWTSTTDGILHSRIDGFDEEIDYIDDQMKQMNARLTMREEALKRKFTEMESALSNLQSQQSWLSSQIGAMSF